MASLFGIIQQYKGSLSMFPTMIVILVAATLVCYIIFNQFKLVKYIPAGIGIVLGMLFLVIGFSNPTAANGLDVIWRGFYFFTSGCIALGTAWIIALISSMTGNGSAKKTKRASGVSRASK